MVTILTGIFALLNLGNADWQIRNQAHKKLDTWLSFPLVYICKYSPDPEISYRCSILFDKYLGKYELLTFNCDKVFWTKLFFGYNKSLISNETILKKLNFSFAEDIGKWRKYLLANMEKKGFKEFNYIVQPTFSNIATPETNAALTFMRKTWLEGSNVK